MKLFFFYKFHSTAFHKLLPISNITDAYVWQAQRCGTCFKTSVRICGQICRWCLRRLKDLWHTQFSHEKHTLLKHLSLHSLLSDRQYGFRQGRSTGYLLAFLTESWSSYYKDFGETFAVALDISKAFDRVWHKALISKLPSFGFYPSLCNFISSFLSDRSIAAVVDGHCSSPKSFNSGVPQGSVLSSTLFLLFINDLLNQTSCPIHSYADDTTLHFFTSFHRWPTLQEVHSSRREASERFTSDLSKISDWGKTNLQCLKNSIPPPINSTQPSK